MTTYHISYIIPFDAPLYYILWVCTQKHEDKSYKLPKFSGAYCFLFLL